MTENLSANHTRQAVVTRLASITSALTFLSLTNNKPAAVTVDEMLVLAEHVERWAWRDLGRAVAGGGPVRRSQDCWCQAAGGTEHSLSRKKKPTVTSGTREDHSPASVESLRYVRQNRQLWIFTFYDYFRYIRLGDLFPPETVVHRSNVRRAPVRNK